MKKKNKKGQISSSLQTLSAVAISFFVFFIVIFATLKGMSTIRQTIPGGVGGASAADNATYFNMTKLEASAGLFTQYSDLIVIVAILAIVISLVAGAFLVQRGKR